MNANNALQEFLNDDHNVKRLMQENEELVHAALIDMPVRIEHDRLRISELEAENIRLRAEISSLRRNKDNLLVEMFNMMKEIRGDQIKQIALEESRSEVCAGAENLREKYRTAKPTNLSDLVGLLNDYVDDEDQYRKDELDE